VDVFLVPLGAGRHELYCETSTPEPDASTFPATGAPPKSLRARAVAIFHEAVDEGEAARRNPDAAAGRSWIRRWLTKKLAETVAEQRLLWHLRSLTTARLWFADDLDWPGALAILRTSMRGDFERHRRWVGIDALLTLAAVPLTVLPGPNVFAFYFIARAVGHYFSLRGARQALDRIAWTPSPTPELSALRTAFDLDPEGRAERVHAIAHALGLSRLPAFIDELRAC
jgi:hypothetical protein